MNIKSMQLVLMDRKKYIIHQFLLWGVAVWVVLFLYTLQHQELVKYQSLMTMLLVFQIFTDKNCLMKGTLGNQKLWWLLKSSGKLTLLPD